MCAEVKKKFNISPIKNILQYLTEYFDNSISCRFFNKQIQGLSIFMLQLYLFKKISKILRKYIIEKIENKNVSFLKLWQINQILNSEYLSKPYVSVSNSLKTIVVCSTVSTIVNFKNLL